MNVIQLGPLTLQGDLLVLIISVFLAIAAMALRLKLENKSSKGMLHWALTLMIALVLNMKFGYLWDSPSVTWEQPKAMLFLSGTSTNGNVLLAIGLLAWTITYVRRHHIPIDEFADTLAHGFLMWLTGYGFFCSYTGFAAPGLTPVPLPETMNASMPPIESICALLLLLGLWIRRRPLGSYSDAIMTALLMGSIGMLLSYMTAPESIWLGLSFTQWGFVLLLLAGYAALNSKEREKHNEVLSAEECEDSNKEMNV